MTMMKQRRFITRSGSIAQSSPSSRPQRVPRKAALLIGVNYHETFFLSQLECPHKDALDMKALLKEKYAYKEDDITVLLDNSEGYKSPTRKTILDEMRALVAGAQPGDRFFFHYSGHGDQVDCQPDDTHEEDKNDEAIIPCDATEDKKTWIIDNIMNEILVRKIPAGSELIAIFDSCHSGTALDLKHYRKKSIYIPLHTEIRRLTSKIRRQDPILCNAPMAPSMLETNSGAQEANTQREAQRNSPRSANTGSQAGTLHIVKRTSDYKVHDKKYKIGSIPTDNPKQRRPSVSVTMCERTSEFDREPTLTPEEMEMSPFSMSANPMLGSGSRKCPACKGWIIEFTNDNESRKGSGNAHACQGARRPQTPSKRNEQEVYVPKLLRSRAITSSTFNHDNAPTFSCGLRIDVPKLRWSPAFPRRVRVDKTDTNLPGRGGCRRNTANVRQPARSSTSVSPAAPTPFFAPKRHSAPVGAITKDGNHMNTAPVPSATFGTRFFLEIDVPRTMSPESFAECRCPFSGQVISISAVREEQIAFEGGSGHSMTSALIDMLRQEPNPSYPKLLEFINAWWCKSSIRMRSYFKERQDSLEEKKKHAKPDELLDIERDLQVVTNCMNSKQVAMIGVQDPISQDKKFSL